jgi:hypothetical protein
LIDRSKSRLKPRLSIAASGMPFEILHVALVLLGSRPARKRPEVSSLAGLGVFLARINPVLSRR